MDQDKKGGGKGQGKRGASVQSHGKAKNYLGGGNSKREVRSKGYSAVIQKKRREMQGLGDERVGVLRTGKAGTGGRFL